MENKNTYCLTLSLHGADRAWRALGQDTFMVETEPSELDGEIVTQLFQMNYINGEMIPLRIPTYLPLENLEGYLQSMAGMEKGAAEGSLN